VDPVMCAKSGDRLLDEDAVSSIARDLLPLATVVTPNLPEAAALSGRPVESGAARRDAARALAALGTPLVVIKGGHDEGDEVVDLVYDARRDEFAELRYERVPGRHTHGTGCTLSAAIA